MAIPALAGVSGADKVASDRASAVVRGTLTAIGPGKAFSAWGPMNLLFWGSRVVTLTTTAASASATVNSATGVSVGDSINSANVPPGTTIKTLAGTDVTFAFMPQAWKGTIGTAAAITGMTAGEGGTGTLPVSLTTLVGATILDSPYFAAGTTITAVGADGTSLVTSAVPTSTPAPGTGPVLIFFVPDGHAITTTGADATAVLTGAATDFATASTINLERSLDGGQTWILCNIGGSGQPAQFVTFSPYSVSFGDAEQCVLYRLNVLAFTGIANVTLNYRISATGPGSSSISVPPL